MPPKPINKGGAPTKYKPEYCNQLIIHMEQGYSFESFGGVVSVSADTLYEWVKVHSQFSEAKKEGKSKSRLWWESQGRDGLWNETSKIGTETITRSINATIWIFNMKNRFGWRDRQEITAEIDHSSKDPKIVEQLTRQLLELQKIQ